MNEGVGGCVERVGYMLWTCMAGDCMFFCACLICAMVSIASYNTAEGGGEDKWTSGRQVICYR